MAHLRVSSLLWGWGSSSHSPYRALLILVLPFMLRDSSRGLTLLFSGPSPTPPPETAPAPIRQLPTLGG